MLLAIVLETHLLIGNSSDEAPFNSNLSKHPVKDDRGRQILPLVGEPGEDAGGLSKFVSLCLRHVLVISHLVGRPFQR